MGANSAGGGASGRGEERLDSAKAKIQASATQRKATMGSGPAGDDMRRSFYDGSTLNVRIYDSIDHGSRPVLRGDIAFYRDPTPRPSVSSRTFASQSGVSV
jgi:hypothetical protein